MIRAIGIWLGSMTLIGGGILVFSNLAELPSDHVFCRAGFCAPGPPTVATEPNNPFGWCDLAESKAVAGDLTGARAAFARAVGLGPNVPPVLIRVVNFEVANGDLERVLPHLRHILELTPAYDGIAFRYLVRGRVGLDRVLSEVLPDPGVGSAAELAKKVRTGSGHASAPDGESRPRGDAARAWLAYLIADRHPEVERAWRWLDQRGGVTPELRNQWVEYLVTVTKEYPKALEAWATAYPEDGYPTENRLFNSRFARERTGGRMDWSLSTHPHVAAKLGEGITLTFDGMDNTAYAHLSQQTFLPAGRWRFDAEAEGNGLTTNKRPYFRISDTFDPRRLDVSTPMAPDRMAVDFTVPPGGSWITVALLRQQSEKFDNKIGGTLRIRQVRIGGANGGT
jgi:hypothetical protein